MVGASVSVAGKLFLIVLYDLIYVLPLIAIVIVCGLRGEEGGTPPGARQRLDRDAMADRRRTTPRRRWRGSRRLLNLQVP